MKFGLHFMAVAHPDGSWVVERWEQLQEATRVAESVGFEMVSLPEHHMFPDGHVASPWAALGALAAQTEKVELCTAVHLLPFEHPIHVAEHSAMVDILSNGRMRLGCGLANFEPEFAYFGLEKREQVSRFEEAVDLVRRAWAGEDLDHAGKHFDVKGKMTPQPVSPQLWLGGMSDPGVRRAARLGAPWITDPLHNIDVLEAWADVYREEGEARGTSDDLELILMRDAWIGDSLDQIEREWWPFVQEDHWFYFQKVPRFVADREPFLNDVTSSADFKFANHHRNRMVVGDAEACIAEIREFRERLGNERLILRARMPSGPDFEHELEAIRRFGTEVIPAFNSERS
jgi:alkanesulfonate monooxygenase SsuD/methylene tetrahydromethanopterin reductase-like flavin-dependent oxidoreductase (luciferase family)